jgi:hypothetical protein
VYYRISSKPRISQVNPAYLWCSAVATDPDSSFDPDPAEHPPIRVLVHRQFAAQVDEGYVFSDEHIRHVEELNANILDPRSAPAVAQTQPAVSRPVQADPRVPATEDGWCDDDHIGAVATTAPPRQQPQHSHPPVTHQRPASIASTVREREGAVLKAGDKIPLDLLRALRITAHSYNLVSTLINATGRPGPQDVRALVITNVIAWTKTDQGIDQAPVDIDAASEALEKILKAQT